ncbi:MAG: tetratricopeptide repeat protein [Verrucomicrobiota bacterium]
MEQSPQLQRALVLHQQGRHDLAEKELRQHLASEPHDGFAHALLAISALEQERLNDAEQSAREAIGVSPDFAFSHYALARVLSKRNREAEAATAIQEAIRLEPTDADYHGMLAGIEFDRRQWQAALHAAETGLQFDPEHVACNNLRAMALVKLGRKAEAGATIERTLARDPDDAFSHANQGWTLLEQGQRKKAMEHFRESLRLDPTNEWAQAGLVEAIKAGNPIYAVMLKYFLWMQKLSDRARWGILLGGYFGNRLLATAAASSPELAPWVLPIRGLYITFALLTWLAHPFFNLTLFLHPYGRHALNKDQRGQAMWVGLCLALALSTLGIWLVSGRHGNYLIPPLVFGLLTIPTSAVFGCAKGWPRTTMTLITLGLATAGLISVAIIGFLQPAKNSDLATLGAGAIGLFLLGSFLSQWLANWLATQRPQR